MQVKNRIHVVFKKSCKPLKEGLRKIYLPRWLFLWLHGLLKEPLQFSRSSYPCPPAGRSIYGFIRSPQWKMPAVLFVCLFFLLKIQLRAQEKYKITSQHRAWIPVWVPRGLSSHSPCAQEQIILSLEPQCGTSILSSQALEARPVHGPIRFLLGPHSRRMCLQGHIDQFPIQGQLGSMGS